MSEPLKPCPFCGVVPGVTETDDKHGVWTYSVRCDHIGCLVTPETGCFKDEPDAIATWNRRRGTPNG